MFIIINYCSIARKFGKSLNRSQSSSKFRPSPHNRSSWSKSNLPTSQEDYRPRVNQAQSFPDQQQQKYATQKIRLKTNRREQVNLCDNYCLATIIKQLVSNDQRMKKKREMEEKKFRQKK